MSTALQTYAPNVTLRIVDGEQFDVMRNGRHIGTVMDDGERRTAHAFSRAVPQVPGMKGTFLTLPNAVDFILERGD